MQLNEIIVDNFAGGGGASTGIELEIGRSVDIAINHDPAAIAMHKANHPTTEHYCEDVWKVDPVKACRGRKVALAWFSPDCKHFSKAKGGKPVDKNIRGLAWVTVKWAVAVRPRVMMLENVEEFKTWGPLIQSEDGEWYPDPDKKGETFKAFISALTTGLEKDHPAWKEIEESLGEYFNRELIKKGLGYKIEFRELKACDYGAPTIRKRFVLIARCDGKPIVWPKPTHGNPDGIEVRMGLLKNWRTAAEIINWDLPCPSIFERKKPLADNTLKRIAKGIQKFVLNNSDPFIVQVNHSGANHHYCNSINTPLPTITSKNGYGLITPIISQIGQTGGGDRLHSIEEPLSTIVSKQEHLLVTPYLAVNNTGHLGGDIKDPIHTITTGGHHALITPTLIQYHTETTEQPRGQVLNKPIATLDTSPRYALVSAFISKYFGGYYEGSGNDAREPLGTQTTKERNALVTSHLLQMNKNCDGRSLNEPINTIVAGPGHLGEVRTFLMSYYGNKEDVGQSCDEPLRTITTKDRFGIVKIHGQDYEIVDIGMRMLEPRELFNGQGFPPDYIIDKDFEGKPYPKTAQVARCGNSVSPPLAGAMTKANIPEYCNRKQAS